MAGSFSLNLISYAFSILLLSLFHTHTYVHTHTHPYTHTHTLRQAPAPLLPIFTFADVSPPRALSSPRFSHRRAPPARAGSRATCAMFYSMRAALAAMPLVRHKSARARDERAWKNLPARDCHCPLLVVFARDCCAETIRGLRLPLMLRSAVFTCSCAAEERNGGNGANGLLTFTLFLCPSHLPHPFLSSAESRSRLTAASPFSRLYSLPPSSPPSFSLSCLDVTPTTHPPLPGHASGLSHQLHHVPARFGWRCRGAG